MKNILSSYILREFLISTKVAYFLNLYKMGRISIPILLKATSPEGETKTFTSIGEAAKELGFSERGVGKAFHEKRNRIGEYELEWFEPEPDVDSKLDDPEAAKGIERLKKTYTQTVCTYCGKPLTREDRVKNGFGIYKIDEKTGHLMEYHEVNSIYEGNKLLTGLSVSSLKNVANKGNVLITRRRDKQRFILSWQSIHERCFQIRKEERWLEMRRKVREGVKT